MKNHLPVLAGICLLATPVIGQIDYNNPVVETVVTRQQIFDYTSTQAENPATGITLRGLVINSAGNFVFLDRGGAQGQARLIEVDASVAPPVFTTIATEAEMAAVLETSSDIDPITNEPLPPPRLNFTGLGHRFDEEVDYYYIANFGQNPNNCATCADEVIEVAAGTPSVVRRVGSLDGIGGISLIGDTIYSPLVGAFSNQIADDGVYTMDIATGTTNEIASVADFTALTGANPGLQGAGMATDGVSLVQVFSEQFRTGSDDFITIDTANSSSLSILEPASTFDPKFPGVASIGIDSNGTLFAFDQFPAGASRRFIIRESDGTISIPDTTILTDALGVTAGQLFFPNDTLRPVVVDSETVVLYALLADGTSAAGNPRIISLTFEAEDVLLIELESFAAAAATPSSPVEISWTTASEIDSVGFNVHRAEASNSGLSLGAKVNDSLIPAEGTSGSGATYTLEDALPVGDASRAYFLVEVDANGSHNQHGPFTATVGGTASTVGQWSRY